MANISIQSFLCIGDFFSIILAALFYFKFNTLVRYLCLTLRRLQTSGERNLVILASKGVMDPRLRRLVQRQYSVLIYRAFSNQAVAQQLTLIVPEKQMNTLSFGPLVIKFTKFKNFGDKMIQTHSFNKLNNYVIRSWILRPFCSLMLSAFSSQRLSKLGNVVFLEVTSER